MTNPNDYYVPTTGKTLKTDGTVINVADAFVSNGDGTNSQQVQLTGSNVTLATIVSATGRQTGQNVASGSSLRLNIWGTATSFDVQVQAQMYDGQWYTLPATNAITGSSVNDVTTAGIYDYDTSAFKTVALNVVSITGGNVNAQGVFLP
jgi:hypothetical protein